MSIHGGRIAGYLTAVGLAAAGAATAPAAAAQEEPAAPSTQEASDAVVLALTDDAGARTELAAASEDAAVLTPGLDVPEFYVAAVTWEGGDTPDEDIALRVRTDDGWTAWTDLEPDTVVEGSVGGTEPYVVGGATGVQVRLAGGDGELPRGLELHLIPPDPGEEHTVATSPEAVAEIAAQSGTRSVTAAAPPTPRDAPAAGQVEAESGVSASAPRVVSRAGWGADESTMTWTIRNDPLRAAVVHHTAGTNSYTAAQSASIVRGIYHYHAITREWGDIGYNFLVDKYGQVFEGRAGSVAAPAGQMPEAGHARGFNRGTLGISVLGDYTTLYAPDSILQTMARVIAWKFDAAGIDMSTPSGFISPGTAHRPKGQNLPRVFAHRDVGNTTCPGNNIYARIPQLHERVAALVDGDDYHLRNSLSGGAADLSFTLGLSTDQVLVGDWTATARTPWPCAAATPTSSTTPTPGRSSAPSGTGGRTTSSSSGTGTVTAPTPSPCGGARSTTSRTPSPEGRPTGSCATGARATTCSSGTGTATGAIPSPSGAAASTTSAMRCAAGMRTSSCGTAGRTTSSSSGTGTATDGTPSRCGVATGTT